jgi:hypothetical protein
MRLLHVLAGCCLAALGSMSTPVAAQITADWIAPVSGDWTNSGRWSSNPVYPNNVGGNSYDAVVDATGAAYTLSLSTPITIDHLTLDSTSATIQQTDGGSLTLLNGLDLHAGSFLLANGSLTTPNLAGAGNFTFDGGNAFSHLLQPALNGTLTIAANATVRTLTGSGTVGRTDGTLVNNGLLVADADHSLTVTGDHWVNNGTLRVDGGSLLLGGTVATASLGTLVNTGRLGARFMLTGTLDNTGATLALTPATGPLALDYTARIVGGTVSGSGSNGIIVAVGTPTLDGVTLAGPALAVAGSGVAQVVNGLTLNNATVTVGDTSSFTGTLQFAGTQTLAGTGELQLQTRGTIKPASGTLTIAPGITVRAKSFYATVGDPNYPLVNQGTIVSDLTTQNFDVTGSTFDNPGKINVAAGSVNLTNINNTGTLNVTGGSARLLGNWHNPGAITLANATLDLGGTFGPADVGVINRTAGTVRVSGTMDLGGGTLNLNATTGPWVLTHNGRIKNGSIQTAGGATLQFVTPGAPGGTLDNVTVASDLTIPYGAIVTVQNGLTLANHSLSINATDYNKPTNLLFDGTQTLGGTGDLVMTGPYAVVAPSNGTLTVGPGVTVRTLGTGGGTLGADALPLVNQGTITSATANGITVRGSTVTNTGAITSTTGSSLQVFNLDNRGRVTAAGTNFFLSGAWHNAGTITTTAARTYLSGTFAAADIGAFSRTGGQLFLDGIFDNTGNVLNLADRFNGPVTLINTITGGTVVGSATAPFTIAAGGTGTYPVLDGVTLDADVTVTGADEWRIRNGLTVASGRKILSDTGAQLNALNDQTITGGEFQFSAPQSAVNPAVFQLTLSPTTTLKSTGANGGVTVGNTLGKVVNNGTIVAASDGGYVTLVGDFTNNGTIRLDAGMLNLGGVDSLGNWGTLQRNGGSVNYIGTLNNTGKTFDPSDTPVGPIDFGTGAIINGGTITASGGRIPKVVRGDLTVGGVAFNDVTLATSLDLQVATAGINGTLTLSGNPTIRIFGAAGTTSGFSQSGPATILGAGTITFENSASSESYVRSSFALTIGPDVQIKTLTGAGNVVGQTVLNQGTLTALAPGKSLIIAGTFTNAGTVEARNNGTVYVNSPVITNLANNTLTGGTWAAYSGSSLLFYNNRTFTTNAADVLLDGPNSAFAPVTPISANSGNFAIDHGRNFTPVGALANSGTLRVGAGSTLTVKGALTNTGQIEGKGTIVANVTSDGTVSPGESPGTLTIAGNFTQTDSGILDIQIAGPNPGADYDVLRVTGTATLGGTLRISLLNGYVPPEGADFSFLQAATRSVNFDEVLLPPQVQWDTAALAGGQIAVVPEPALFWLAPLLILLHPRRPRRTRRATASIA